MNDCSCVYVHPNPNVMSSPVAVCYAMTMCAATASWRHPTLLFWEHHLLASAAKDLSLDMGAIYAKSGASPKYDFPKKKPPPNVQERAFKWWPQRDLNPCYRRERLAFCIACLKSLCAPSLFQPLKDWSAPASVQSQSRSRRFMLGFILSLSFGRSGFPTSRKKEPGYPSRADLALSSSHGQAPMLLAPLPSSSDLFRIAGRLRGFPSGTSRQSLRFLRLKVA